MSEAPRNERQSPSALDFLGRVIHSAFERGSPLEPRLPSLFEPRTVAAAAAVASLGDLAGTDEEQAPRETPQDGMFPLHESGGRAAPDAARVAKADHEPEVAAGPPAGSPARRDRKEEDRSALVPLQRGIDGRCDGRPEAARDLQRPLLDLPSGVRLTREVVSTPEMTREPMVARAPESRTASLPSAERSERVYDHPMAPAPGARRIVVEPPTVLHRPRRQSLRAEMATPGPEPVVNVTIGRIEVRAVLAPPGSARQRPQKPKPMSLDEYLKQRGGG